MKIILTETAERSYHTILNNYKESKASAFSKKTISVIEIIGQNNHIGLKHKKTSYRKFLVSNQVYLFYKVEETAVFIVLFWDNKRNPVDLEIILSS